MNKLKIISLLGAVVLIVAVGSAIVGVDANNDSISVNDGGILNMYNGMDSAPTGVLGGTTHLSGPLDVSGGYKVDDTTVIDSNGKVDGTITSDSGTFSSTLTVSGESNLDTLVSGGTTTTSPTATTTLTAAQVCDNNYIGADPTGGARNITTPNATDIISDCLPANGDAKTFFFENLADAAEAYTVVAGSNIDLIEPSGGDVIIQQNEDAKIEMLNVDGSTVKVYVTSMQAAD